MRWIGFINKLIILFTTIIITGCYTVIWTPEDRMPSESNYSEEVVSEMNEDYYPIVLYGGYNYYYIQPWWYSLSYTPSNQNINTENNLDDTESLRNNGNGRNTDSGRDPIIETAPPSISTNTSSGNNTNSNSGSNTQTENSNTRSQSSDNDNNIRNDNGSRNSEGKRK